MFHKPFRVKSNTQLKGSERKRIRQEIVSQFPQISDTELEGLIPLKEVMSVMKIITHSGDSGLVYCVRKLPVIFELGEIIYPTVYMLWSFPSLLPAFTTWPQVFERLVCGADLMLPGIVLKEKIHLKVYGTLHKGDRVAINLTTNKAPVAIGQAALSSYDMYMAALHGKAVKVLHVIGDQLWSYGTKLKIPDLGPPLGYEEETEIIALVEDHAPSAVPTKEVNIDPFDKGNIASESVTLTSRDVGGGEFLSAGDLKESEDETLSEDFANMIELDSIEPVDQGDQVCEKVIEHEADTGKDVSLEPNPHETMDLLIEYCFLKAWKTSAKKVNFPLLTSNFYKLHMIPACPAGKQLDLKKSSYRKLSKFLSVMEDSEILKVKELTKGVESIMSVNINHEKIRDFVDVEDSQDIMGQTLEVTSKTVKPAITELYTVTAAVLKIFSTFGIKKGASLPVASVRKYVTDYVKKEKLQDASNKNMVTVNSALQSVVQNQNTVAVSWEDLMALVIGRMSRSYQMTFSGEKPVTNKGKLDPIDIQVGKRTGNKKVTLINNLELYGINIQEFARECQHGVAASTSISSIAGKKSQQLLVQGNQVLFVGNLLMGKYQIPKRYIRGLDNAPRQKK